MDYLHKIDRNQMYGAILPNRLYKLHGWPCHSIPADAFNARANRARQRKKGPCVRRGRKYP